MLNKRTRSLSISNSPCGWSRHRRCRRCGERSISISSSLLLPFLSLVSCSSRCLTRTRWYLNKSSNPVLRYHSGNDVLSVKKELVRTVSFPIPIPFQLHTSPPSQSNHHPSLQTRIQVANKHHQQKRPAAPSTTQFQSSTTRVPPLRT